MTREREIRQKDLVQAALYLSPDERREFLDRECARDPEMRAGVERFLATCETLPGGYLTALIDASVVPPAPPPRLEDFDGLTEIVLLSTGGMGVVYRAVSTGLDATVVLKMPRPDCPVPGELFLRDPRSIAQLQHRNIIQVYQTGTRDGRPYFTMRFAEGGDIGRYVAAHERDPRLVARLMVKVARGVMHAHQRGILHRDLKPGNVLMDADGEPLVTDFGLATRAVGPELAGPIPAASFAAGSRSFQGLVGTVAYMPPEQATDAKGVTTLSDVYGLGALLYALLTGHPPFPGGDIKDVLRQVRDPACRPGSPRATNARVDRSLEAICLKALEKDPARRYASAEGLARDLERWLAAEEVEARPLPVFHPDRVARWCWRNPGWAALTGLAGVLLLLSAVLANLAAASMVERALVAGGESATRSAELVADNALWLIRDLGRDVLAAAESPETRRLISETKGLTSKEDLKGYFVGEEGAARRAPFADRFARCNRRLKDLGIPAFATMYFLNADGRLVHLEYDLEHPAARQENQGDLFDLRDYFRVPMKSAKAGLGGMHAVHVSCIFHSQFDGLYKFAIAAPVVEEGIFLGVVSAALPAHRTLGLGGGDLDRTMQQAILIGRVDRSPSTALHPRKLDHEYHVLRHTAMTANQVGGMFPFQVTEGWPGRDTNRPELLSRREGSLAYDPDFRDPLAGESQREKRLAGIAQVGNTDLVVVVHQSHADAIGGSVLLARTFIWSAWGALAAAFGLAVAVTVLRSWLRRPAAV